jgi:hypothetical protein
VSAHFGKVERLLDAKRRGTTVNKAYSWQVPYEAAMLEIDDAKLTIRLQQAKFAIDTRLHELRTDHGGTAEERQAISDALAGLNMLRRELEARSRDTGSTKDPA